MTDDLISRQAAIEAVTKYCINNDLRELLADIERLPTAEKKGKWIDYCGGVKCDQCGFECDDTYYLGEANFCPNCGADMREESDE